MGEKSELLVSSQVGNVSGPFLMLQDTGAHVQVPPQWSAGGVSSSSERESSPPHRETHSIFSQQCIIQSSYVSLQSLPVDSISSSIWPFQANSVVSMPQLLKHWIPVALHLFSTSVSPSLTYLITSGHRTLNILPLVLK